MPAIESKFLAVVDGATNRYNAWIEKAVGDFVCRHMQCGHPEGLEEAAAIMENAAERGLEFVILVPPLDEEREIAVRRIGEIEFFDRAALPSFRELMLGEKV